jgi:hypothetical protein
LLTVIYRFYVAGMYSRQVEMRKLGMDSDELNRANATPDDDAIVVVGASRMKNCEKKLAAPGKPGIVSFVGSTDFYEGAGGDNT